MSGLIGNAMKMGFETELQGLEALLSASPEDPDILVKVAEAYVRKQNFGVAINLAVRAVQKQLSGQSVASAYNVMGAALVGAGFNGEAHWAWTKALEFDPGNAGILVNLSSTLVVNATPEAALAAAEVALKASPDSKIALFNKCVALLEMGRWNEAWPLHHSRDCKGILGAAQPILFDFPKWDGKTPVKRLMVCGEQGIGDQIMLMSCFKKLRHLAEDVVIRCHYQLEALFKDAFSCRTSWDEGEVFDAQVFMGDLPGLIGKMPMDDSGKYLDAPAMLPKSEKPRIGISWMGGTPRTKILERSISLENLAPILELDAEFISLQYGNHVLHEGSIAKSGYDILHNPAWIGSYPMTAAIVASCDFIVTVCTALHHLAGAMGVPTLTLVPSRPAWRYGLSGSRSPWYESAVLFRGTDKDGLTPAIAEAAEYLGGRLPRERVEMLEPQNAGL